MKGRVDLLLVSEYPQRRFIDFSTKVYSHSVFHAFSMTVPPVFGICTNNTFSKAKYYFQYKNNKKVLTTKINENVLCREIERTNETDPTSDEKNFSNVLEKLYPPR